MKRKIGHILLTSGFIAVFYFIYVQLFKISVAFIIGFSIFLTVYAFLLGVCWKSMDQIKKYEQKAVHFGLNREDDRKILFYSLTTLAPILLCDVLVSLIPLYTYEVWFLTAFPWIVITCVPAMSILGEYRALTHKRLSFLSLFTLLTLTCCLLGATVSHFLLQ